jgi:hypothetical protein
MENDSVLMEVGRADGEAESSNPVFCTRFVRHVHINTNVLKEIVNK